MANGIVDVVTDCNTIATADVAIGTFIYGEQNSVNVEDRGQVYPLMLFHDTHPFTYSEGFDFSTNFEQTNRTYTVKWSFYDTRYLSGTVDLQQSFTDLAKIAEQYLREFISRSEGDTMEVTTKQDWSIEENSITVSEEKKRLNDLLVEIVVDMTIEVRTNCDLGDFVY